MNYIFKEGVSYAPSFFRYILERELIKDGMER